MVPGRECPSRGGGGGVPPGGGGGVTAAATVNDRLTGALTLPAPSRARTSKVCGPGGSGGVVNGELHGSKSPPSTRHSNVSPARWRRTRTSTAALSVPVGPDAIVACGRVSITNERPAGHGPTLPAGVGRTHLEGVRPVGQRRIGQIRRRARLERAAVDAALERRIRLRRAERERPAWCRWSGPPDSRDRRLRRVVSTRERPARRRAGVAEGIGRAHLEGVRRRRSAEPS